MKAPLKRFHVTASGAFSRPRAKLGGGRGAYRLTREGRVRRRDEEMLTSIHGGLEAGLKVVDRWAIAIGVAAIGFLTHRTLITMAGVALGYVAFLQLALMPGGVMWHLQVRLAAHSLRRRARLMVVPMLLLMTIGAMIFGGVLVLATKRPG